MFLKTSSKVSFKPGLQQGNEEEGQKENDRRNLDGLCERVYIRFTCLNK
jgi:hypothetical protein